MRTPCTESACSWATSIARTRLATPARTTTEAGRDAVSTSGVLRSPPAGRQGRASETLLQLSTASLLISYCNHELQM